MLDFIVMQAGAKQIILTLFYFWFGKYNKTLNDWPRGKHRVYFSSFPFHTTQDSEKFENAALLLLLVLPSTLIRHQNGVFRKRSSYQKNFKTPALCLSCKEQ